MYSYMCEHVCTRVYARVREREPYHCVRRET